MASDNKTFEPVERRAFLRNALGASMGLSVAGGGVGFIGMLWPSLGGGFGADIKLPDSAEAIYNQIVNDRSPYEYPAGRMYVVAWDPSVSGAEDVYGVDHSMLDGTRGLMALYQKCVHLGCRVPWCQSSQWYECPCHGSKYNKWGEWVGGPAPRGLDRFPSTIDGDGNLIVRTGTILTGPARTAKVLQQEAEGPNCVSL